MLPPQHTVRREMVRQSTCHSAIVPKSTRVPCRPVQIRLLLAHQTPPVAALGNFSFGQHVREGMRTIIDNHLNHNFEPHH